MPNSELPVLLKDIKRQIDFSRLSSKRMYQRRLTPRECPVLQDIDGDIAAVLAHDGLLPTEELVTAITDFIPTETVKSCRVQLFEVARSMYSEVVGKDEQAQTVPLRLKSRRGVTARAACARDLVQLFTYICGLLPHFPLDTLAAQCHPLMTQIQPGTQPFQQPVTRSSQCYSGDVDNHQSNTGDTDSSGTLMELVDRCSDHDRAIVDMRCALNNALNELDKIKHKNTQCLTADLSPNATVCDHNSSHITVSLDSEYPCPAQPLRDPGHQHQQDAASLTISTDSSILLTLGDCPPSPTHLPNEDKQVGIGADAILPTPECSFDMHSGSNSSLTALLQSTPHDSPVQNVGTTPSTDIADKSVECNLLGSDIKSSIDNILTEIRVMKENHAALDERVCAIEARHSSDDQCQPLRDDLNSLGGSIENIRHTLDTLAGQMQSDKSGAPSSDQTNAISVREVATIPCSNRFAVLDSADDAASSQSPMQHDARSSAAPLPARPKRSSGRGNANTSAQRQRQRDRRPTKVTIVGSSLVRGLGNQVNDKDTGVCCHTFPGGTIERIAPRLPEVTRADDDVIVLAAGSNNIPQYDVATIIRRAGEMIDDLRELRPHAHLVIPAIPRRYDDPDHRDLYRDKIDRVNVFLQHKCKKSSRLHFLKHDFCFGDYKADGLHLNQHGVAKYAQNIKSIINMVNHDISR